MRRTTRAAAAHRHGNLFEGEWKEGKPMLKEKGGAGCLARPCGCLAHACGCARGRLLT